jgi:hypothetical protein
MHQAIDLLAPPTHGMAHVDWVVPLHPATARRWIDGYDGAARSDDL